MFMFMDSGAKNYPGTLRAKNKYATFDILANPIGGLGRPMVFMGPALQRGIQFFCARPLLTGQQQPTALLSLFHILFEYNLT